MEIKGTWYAEGMMRDVAKPVSTGALYTTTFNAISNYADGAMAYPLSKGIGFQASKNWTGETSSFGGSQAHNIMNPYHTCYIWRRTK